jgi:hypothetical protein
VLTKSAETAPPSSRSHLMSIHSQKLQVDRLSALDGEIPRARDLCFDDQNGVVRRVVVDAASWLASRLVPLSPCAFGPFDELTSALNVNLSRAQIENSPAFDSQPPVSRQYEIDCFSCDGWPVHGNGEALGGMASRPATMPPSRAEITERFRRHDRDDTHLQKAHAVMGYGVEASEGTRGSMRGLPVDDRTWAVDEIAVEAGHWFSEKEIRISTREFDRTSWEDSRPFVRVAKAHIRRTLENGIATAEAMSSAATDQSLPKGSQ